MNDIQVSLRAVFQTANRFTIAISGTGSAGMEASIMNVVEPGDSVVVGINGVFGNRIASVVERCGGKTARTSRGANCRSRTEWYFHHPQLCSWLQQREL
jgi:alanine-glyoxylate transaminase/serine-glyoxylate transaminase/serine-pyruvate transaminase